MWVCKAEYFAPAAALLQTGIYVLWNIKHSGRAKFRSLRLSELFRSPAAKNEMLAQDKTGTDKNGTYLSVLNSMFSVLKQSTAELKKAACRSGESRNPGRRVVLETGLRRCDGDLVG